MFRAIVLSFVLHGFILLVMYSERVQFSGVPASVGLDLSATLVRQPSEHSEQTRALPEFARQPTKLTQLGISRDQLKRENSARILPKIMGSTAAIDMAAEKPTIGGGTVALAGERRRTEVAEASDSASEDGLRRYRLSLAREARRFREYPAPARLQGWEGVVVLRLDGAAGPGLPTISLEKSSGYPLLDEQALAMMASSVRETILPKDLSAKRFVISLPIHYRLDE